MVRAHIYTTLLAIGLTAAVAEAETISYSYNVADSEASGYGYATTETYSAAIRVSNPLLVGKRIVGVRFRVPENGGSINPTVSGWVMSSLPADGPTEAAMKSSGSVTAEGTEFYVPFESAVELPPEGVYAGYSVTVETLASVARRYPLEIVNGDTEGGLYIYTPSRGKWTDAAAVSEKLSTMEVMIEGDFPSEAVAISLAGEQLVLTGEEASVNARITNYGTSAVTAIAYKTSISGEEYSGEYNLTEPLSARFGAYTDVTLRTKTPETPGDVLATIEVDGVNGELNEAYEPTSSANVTLTPVIPLNRPLVEEYTGLWCGSCPAGYVALEQGNLYYGSDFVAIAYHVNDALQTGVTQPSHPNGLPAVYINREKTAGPTETLERWAEARAKQVAADIDITLEWADSKRQALIATSKTTFIRDISAAHYAVVFTLVADKLTDRSWGQANYFSGQQNSGPFWDLFSKGGGYVYGLEFNNVPLLASAMNDGENALPTSIEAFRAYTHTHTFTLSDAQQNLLQNSGNLKVVAAIVDTSSPRLETLNSVCSGYSSAASVSQSVDEVAGEAKIVAVRYYSLQGQLLPEAPQRGNCIEVSEMSDGSIASKIIMAR